MILFLIIGSILLFIMGVYTIKKAQIPFEYILGLASIIGSVAILLRLI